MSSISQPSILVVEDSDEDFAAIERILRRSQAPVGLRRCTRAEQTFTVLEEMRESGRGTSRFPSLIVLDLNLPGRDGRYVLTELRRQPELKKIPVVIFSTSNDPQDVTWCYENGANSYHVKDLDYDIFKHAVEQLRSYWLTSAKLPGAAEKFPSS